MASVWGRLAVGERPVQPVYMYASVRVCCAWMAEESVPLQGHGICKLLSFLLML